MRATLETAIVRAKAEVSLLSAIMEDDLLQVKRIVEKLPELLHTKLKSFVRRFLEVNMVHHHD